jgi:hypothetical protein
MFFAESVVFEGSLLTTSSKLSIAFEVVVDYFGTTLGFIRGFGTVALDALGVFLVLGLVTTSLDYFVLFVVVGQVGEDILAVTLVTDQHGLFATLGELVGVDGELSVVVGTTLLVYFVAGGSGTVQLFTIVELLATSILPTVSHRQVDAQFTTGLLGLFSESVQVVSHMFTATLGIRVVQVVFAAIRHSLRGELQTVLQYFLALATG